jgi:hypothetical protein
MQEIQQIPLKIRFVLSGHNSVDTSSASLSRPSEGFQHPFHVDDMM